MGWYTAACTLGGGGPSLRTFVPNQLAYQETTLETSGTSSEAETGGVLINYVPKDGGNRFSGAFLGAYTNHNLQTTNLSSEVQARGLTVAPQVDQIWDWGGAFGGPIRQDKLWFFTATRWWGTKNTVPGEYYNATQHTLFYTPDLSRPALTGPYQQDITGRLNWQAAAKHKISGSFHSQQQASGIGLLARERRRRAGSDRRSALQSELRGAGDVDLSADQPLALRGRPHGVSRVHRGRTGWRASRPRTCSVTDLGLGLTYGSRNAGLTSQTAYGAGGPAHVFNEHSMAGCPPRM